MTCNVIGGESTGFCDNGLKGKEESNYIKMLVKSFLNGLIGKSVVSTISKI